MKSETCTRRTASLGVFSLAIKLIVCVCRHLFACSMMFSMSLISTGIYLPPSHLMVRLVKYLSQYISREGEGQYTSCQGVCFIFLHPAPAYAPRWKPDASKRACAKNRQCWGDERAAGQEPERRGQPWAVAAKAERGARSRTPGSKGPG